MMAACIEVSRPTRRPLRSIPAAAPPAARLLLLLAMLPMAAHLSIPSARAEEPKGCAAFKWPLDQEAGRLQAAAEAAPAVAKPDGTAYTLKLVPLDEAHLARPPERKPKVTPSRAGDVAFAAPAAGVYQVAISIAAWIDIVQGGAYVRPITFSGATDCPGVRKSIRFDLAAAPFTVQISGTAAPVAALLVEPVRP